jgi:hypothetical protein
MRRAALVGAAMALASCAHEKRSQERPVVPTGPPAQPSRPATAETEQPPAPPPLNRRAMLVIGDRSYQSWIATVRECTPAEVAGAKPHLPGAQADLARRKPAVSIEGRLLPDQPDCTLIDCGPASCCNDCSFAWVVVPRRDCPGRKLKVYLPGSTSSLAGCGLDCAARGFAREADWVIVAGRIDGKGDTVVEAQFCRLPSVAIGQAKDQLTDADYQRLTAPPGKRPAGEDAPNCPATTP